MQNTKYTKRQAVGVFGMDVWCSARSEKLFASFRLYILSEIDSPSSTQHVQVQNPAPTPHHAPKTARRCIVQSVWLIFHEMYGRNHARVFFGRTELLTPLPPLLIACRFQIRLLSGWLWIASAVRCQGPPRRIFLGGDFI